MARKNKSLVDSSTKGMAAFEAFYEDRWGSRWPLLRESLKNEKEKINLNDYLNVHGGNFQRPQFDYLLDSASVAVAAVLGVKPAADYLDLCAAPGGKSLTLIGLAMGEGRFTLNEFSENRRLRMLRVLREHLPEEFLKNTHVKGGAGERFGLKYAASFDRVLIDAPCSGERYQLKHPEQIAKWTKKTSSSLAVRQLALLCAGFDCLRAGGRLVYSTCSLSPLENELLIQKFNKKRDGIINLNESLNFAQLSDLNLKFEADDLQRGFHVLPDESKGAGPIFFSVIGKNEET